jgi:hypothetical protein
VRVVTSDRPLIEAVSRSGAEVVGSGAFRRRLDELTQDTGARGRRPPA